MCLQCREEIVYEGSKKLAKLYDIRPEKYRIHIVAVLKHKADMAIEPGPVVQIYLTPELIAPKILRVKLISAFAFIQKHNLIHPVEIVSYGYLQEANKKHATWVRTNFGDAIADLIPRTSYRMDSEVVTHVTLTHRQSGLNVTVSGTESRYVLEQQARMELSRLVREFNDEPAIADVHDNEGQSTAYLAENGSGEHSSGESTGSGREQVAGTNSRINGDSYETRTGMLVPIGLIVGTRFELECVARGLVIEDCKK
jgi:hypothetical protein